jgi:cyclopropane fatty-acyl-phospholipid synthase-like methyltransferase
MEGGYYKTIASVKEYITLAKDVDGAQLIEKLKQYLPKNSSLLEIGSGPGLDWKLLNKYFEVIGSDNSKEFLNHLKASNPNGLFLSLDAGSLDTDKRFNGIYSNKVLHHLTNEELTKSIERQHSILNSDGIICHSFWRGEGSEIFKGLFVNYHEKQNLKTLFKAHFEILYLDFYNEFDEDDSILLIGKKK